MFAPITHHATHVVNRSIVPFSNEFIPSGLHSVKLFETIMLSKDKKHYKNDETKISKKLNSATEKIIVG